MPLYYIETDMGCGIRYAKSIRQAWSNLRREEGTNHAENVKLATQEDIDNVEAMGGFIPEKSKG